jgi:hypothetical protein
LQPRLPTIDQNGRLTIYSKDDRDRAAKLFKSPEELGMKPIQATPYAKYEDIIAGIRSFVGEEGFALDFPDLPGDAPQGAGDKIKVTARLSHIGGHVETASLVFEHDASGSKNKIQAIGSTQSYGMRMNARRLLNFVSKYPGDADDDGKASGEPIAVKGEPEPPATLDPAQSIALRSAMADIGMRASSILTWAKIAFDPEKPQAELLPLLDTLPADKFGKAMAIINQKKAAKDAEAKTKGARK